MQQGEGAEEQDVGRPLQTAEGHNAVARGSQRLPQGMFPSPSSERHPVRLGAHTYGLGIRD